jgi:hypothetical protein
MIQMMQMKPSRNLWPLGIMLAFALFFAGTLSLVVMACSHKMDLVSSDYYEREIKYETHLDRLRRTGSQASIVYDRAARRIAIGLPRASSGLPLSGWVELYRPSAAELDRRYPLSLDAQGVHSVDARELSPGLWKVRVSWNATGQDFFAEQSVIVGPS